MIGRVTAHLSILANSLPEPNNQALLGQSPERRPTLCSDIDTTFRHFWAISLYFARVVSPEETTLFRPEGQKRLRSGFLPVWLDHIERKARHYFTRACRFDRVSFQGSSKMRSGRTYVAPDWPSRSSNSVSKKLRWEVILK